MSPLSVDPSQINSAALSTPAVNSQPHLEERGSAANRRTSAGRRVVAAV
jgi:hypothetical protein